MTGKKRPAAVRWLGFALAAAAIVLYWYESRLPATTTARQDGEALILAAWQDHRSGLWVETGGEVRNLLADDNEGSRHQRFILELPGGHTVLVAHNIDLAPRVPLAAADTVRLRGMYEWNERGGVLHWTHHDPRGAQEGGWIDLRGERYR